MGACAHCGCDAIDGHVVHVLVALVADDDIDAALAGGLLEAEPCTGCDPACAHVLLAAREARRSALAARSRYRARQARLARLQVERERARTAPQAAAAQSAGPALPPAAADALARALAKAGRR